MSYNEQNPIAESRVRIPRASYRLRILDATKRDSKKGTPMAVLETEIVHANSIEMPLGKNPETGEDTSVTIDINGMQPDTHYQMLGGGNPRAVNGAYESLANILGQLNIPCPPVDKMDELDVKGLIGGEFSAVVETVQEEQTDRTGKPIFSSIPGRENVPLKRWRTKIIAYDNGGVE